MFLQKILKCIVSKSPLKLMKPLTEQSRLQLGSYSFFVQASVVEALVQL